MRAVSAPCYICYTVARVLVLTQVATVSKSITMQRKPHVVSSFQPPVGLRHRHVQSLLAGWPFRQPWLRRQTSPMLAAAQDEIVDCGGGVRLLGHFSPRQNAARGL